MPTLGRDLSAARVAYDAGDVHFSRRVHAASASFATPPSDDPFLLEEVGGIADGSAAPAAGSRAASTTLNAASVASSDALHATQRLHISSNAGVRVEPQDEAAEDVYGARSPTAKTPSPTQPHCTELGHSTLETSDMRSALTGSMDALMMSLLLLITTAAVAPAGASWAPNVPACAAAGLAYTLWAAARDYVRFKTEYAIFYRERAREAWELENYPAGERGEMIELYMKCGVARDDAHAAVASLAKYSDFFVSLMMVQELGMRAPDSKPLNNGINAALGSLLGFAAPLSAAALAEKLVPGQPLALAALVVLSSAATLFLAMRRVVPPAWLVGATTRHGLSMCAAAVLGVAALAVAL